MKKYIFIAIAILLPFLSKAQCSEKPYTIVADLTSKMQDSYLLHSLKIGAWGKLKNPISVFIGVKQELITTTIDAQQNKPTITNTIIETKPFLELGFKLYRSDKFLERVFVQTGSTTSVGAESAILIQNNLFFKLVYQTDFKYNQFGGGVCVAF